MVAPQGVRGSEGHMVMVVATAERSGTVGEAWEDVGGCISWTLSARSAKIRHAHPEHTVLPRYFHAMAQMVVCSL